VKKKVLFPCATQGVLVFVRTSTRGWFQLAARARAGTMDVFHAAECDTLRGEIDRLQNYAARLVVHNDALLKMTAKQSTSLPDDAFHGQPRGGPAPSLGDLPPPWHHPQPAPPPEGCGAAEKLGLQAKVIAHKLEDLERSASDASALLGEILRRGDAEASRGTDPSATLRRLARVVEPGLRRDAEALVALDARETTLAARARDDPGPSETDAGTLRALEDALRRLLTASASAGARVAQLVQVGAILEVASSALRAAAEEAETERASIRDARTALARRLDVLLATRVDARDDQDGRRDDANETRGR
jgi:hypothetical protein